MSNRHWRKVYSILEQYGDVCPSRIDIDILRHATRRRTSGKKEYQQVMKRIEAIRRERQHQLLYPISNELQAN